MIKNLTKKKKIIGKYKLADSILLRCIGLMFSRKSHFNYGLIFDLNRETRIGAGLHMFFVFFSINVVFLDSKKKVVDIKTKFKPFTVYTTNKKCRYIIEFPLKINNRYYSIGDKIEWEYQKQ